MYVGFQVVRNYFLDHSILVLQFRTYYTLYIILQYYTRTSCFVFLLKLKFHTQQISFSMNQYYEFISRKYN